MAEKSLGKLTVDIVADASQLKSQLEDAKTQSAQAAQAVEASATAGATKATSKVGAAIGRIGGQLSQIATGIPGIGSLLTALSGPLALVAGAVTGILVLYDQWHAKQMAIKAAYGELLAELERIDRASRSAFSQVNERNFAADSEMAHKERLNQIDIETEANIVSIRKAADEKYRQMKKDGTDSSQATRAIYEERDVLIAREAQASTMRVNQERAAFALLQNKQREADAERIKRAAETSKQIADAEQKAIDEAEVYQARGMVDTWMAEKAAIKEAGELRLKYANEYAEILRKASEGTTQAVESALGRLNGDSLRTSIEALRQDISTIAAANAGRFSEASY